jgi:hypothetical protein
LRTPFTTRETVARETPATRATSSNVGGCCVVTCSF